MKVLVSVKRVVDYNVKVRVTFFYKKFYTFDEIVLLN